jgi:ParB family chromosome partitioning protein
MTTGTADTGILEAKDQAYKILPLEKIRESKTNPRKTFNAQALEDLAKSVKEKGIIVPPLVRPVDGHFEIVAGARRYRAAKKAGLSEIPVLVRELSDDQALEAQVIENLQRQDVHPLEEGEGYQSLLTTGRYDVDGLAAKVGKSSSYIYQRLKLAELIDPAKKAFLEDRITAGHAVLIARLVPDDQKAALGRCVHEVDVADGDPEDWGHKKSAAKTLITVRDLSNWIEGEIHTDLAKMPWDMADADLVPKAGPCATCPKRTGNSPGLFPEIQKDTVCTDRACFKDKFNAWIDLKIKELKAQDDKVVVISEEQYNWRLAPVEGRAGVKRLGEWHRIGKKKCRNAGLGIMFEGASRGKIIEICTAASCSVHNPKPTYRDYSGSSPAKPKTQAQIEKEKKTAEAAALKQKRDGELLTALYIAAVDAGPPKLELEDLQQLAIYASRGDQPQDLARIFPWAEGYGQHDKHILKLKEKDLIRYLRCTLLADYDSPDEKLVLDACKRWKVPVDKIKKQLKAAWEAADAGKAFPEPTCGRCKCTELNACPGGCSWILLDRATNCGICSKCATDADYTKADKLKAKLAKKTKK